MDLTSLVPIILTIIFGVIVLYFSVKAIKAH